MNAYIYQATLICEDCACKVKQELTAKGKVPLTPQDEYSFDSDDYPKGPFSDGGGESDSPQHCDRCNVFLENPLTRDGERYTSDAIRKFDIDNKDNAEVINKWRDFYSYLLQGNDGE